MPRISLDGQTFYYQQAGEGPDVVLIHGVTGNLAIWMLIDLVQALAEDFRVTAYDLRGHGYSTTPPTGYTSADMANDLLALRAALGLGPMYLVGHSFGGVIAHHTAVLAPDAVRGLVLSDPYFPGLRDLEAGVSQWAGWQAYKEEATAAGLEVSDDAWFDVGQLFHQVARLEGERYEMFKKELGLAAMDRLARLADTTCGEDIKAVAGLTPERIVAVRQPVLALYGEHSPFLATCRYLAGHLPDCKVALVPGARHRAHEENPTGYVSLLRENLRSMAGLPGAELWETGRRTPVGGAA